MPVFEKSSSDKQRTVTSTKVTSKSKETEQSALAVCSKPLASQTAARQPAKWPERGQQDERTIHPASYDEDRNLLEPLGNY